MTPRRASTRIAWLLCCIGVTVGCSPEHLRAERVAELRTQLSHQGVAPLPEVQPATEARVALGRMLFFDPLLSGNRDMACSTCHSPLHATTDGRSLPVGTAAITVDGSRLPGPEHRFIPRNAPALANRGNPLVQSLFWDGRMERQEDGSPLIYDNRTSATGAIQVAIPDRIETLLGALVLFPVMDRDEMRGEPDEYDIYGQVNELARYPDSDFKSVWAGLATRIRETPEYQPLLAEAFEDQAPEDLVFADAANAMADFMRTRFALRDSPFDRFVDGDDNALTDEALLGALTFYSESSCSGCHAGSLLTDQQLYNLGVRPLGRGPTDDVHVDEGAAHRSHAGRSERYTFRTPPLRQAAVTGPWMHNGAYTDLEAVLAHHQDPEAGLFDYDSSPLESAIADQVHQDPALLDDVASSISPDILQLRTYSDREIDHLLAFLHALTDPSVADLSDLTPDTVPSHLPLVEP